MPNVTASQGSSSEPTPEPAASPCLSCGACCAYSHEWPRFSTESDEELALIPEELVAASLSGMRCAAERCLALDGRIGAKVACTIYAVRPHVCRACEIGDDACATARAHHGLPPITTPSRET